VCCCPQEEKGVGKDGEEEVEGKEPKDDEEKEGADEVYNERLSAQSLPLGTT
jgi:hypothetical protein